MPYYPWFLDNNFSKALLSKKEINSYKLTENKLKETCLEDYQYLVSNYINPASPYTSLLLYLQTGVGKTFASISIAENFIRNDKSKQIFVITKSRTLISNFISDLINICSPYASKEELKIMNDKNNENSSKVEKLIKSRINKHYTFITYNFLKEKQVDFTNKVVIIDEVHNLLGNTGYDSVMKAIKSSKNYRLVLLSATPVYDDVSDIFQLSNILNGKYNQFPRDLGDKGYTKLVHDSSIDNKIYKNEIVTLTDKGKEELIQKLAGKIVYLKVSVKDFPTVSYPRSVQKINNKVLPIPIVPCYMSGIQEKYYLEASKLKINSLSGNLESMSSIIYPDSDGMKYFGKAGMDLYIKGNKNSDFLLEKNIQQHSTKLYNLLQNIKLSKGKIYIHSNSITNDGAPLIYKFLKKNGYSKIAVLTSETTAEKISKTIKDFNSVGNDNGDIINIIIGSGIISEGITLKSVRQVHIYEPQWNYSSIDQITGRAIRKSSHSSLPLADRNVEVYLYCAISSDIGKSVDFSKYYLSSLKDLEIKKLERALAKSSFSCPLTKSRNVVKNGVNYSRNCDYSTCDYTCDNDPDIGTIDTSTYNVFLHNKELYNEVVPKIISIFKKTNSISLKDLVKISGYDNETLSNIMKYKPPVQVDYVSGIYILKGSKNTQKNVAKIPRKKSGEGSSSGSTRGFINEKGLFSLEIAKANKINRKVCVTGFDKPELISLVLVLGLKLPAKQTKKTLCQVLSNHYLISS
jgi:superfamily II DNA or RNA helicase